MADHLCVNCSICCDGTLFRRVPVSQEEIDRLGERGSFFTKSDGSLRMRLGCQNLGRDGGCQVYEDRPETCRTYRCRLLKRVDAGEVTEAHAIGVVAEIRAAEKTARTRISEALGEEAFGNATATVHASMKRLKALPQSGDKPSKEVAHAQLSYQHFTDLLRLHLQPNFK